jgi:hypothetical protein
VGDHVCGLPQGGLGDLQNGFGDLRKGLGDLRKGLGDWQGGLGDLARGGVQDPSFLRGYGAFTRTLQDLTFVNVNWICPSQHTSISFGKGKKP